MELGTAAYPYKTTTLALIEIFNYLPGDTQSIEVMVKEGTTDRVKTLFLPLFVTSAYNLTIRYAIYD